MADVRIHRRDVGCTRTNATMSCSGRRTRRRELVVQPAHHGETRLGIDGPARAGGVVRGGDRMQRGRLGPLSSDYANRYALASVLRRPPCGAPRRPSGHPPACGAGAFARLPDRARWVGRRHRNAVPTGADRSRRHRCVASARRRRAPPRSAASVGSWRPVRGLAGGICSRWLTHHALSVLLLPTRSPLLPCHMKRAQKSGWRSRAGRLPPSVAANFLALTVVPAVSEAGLAIVVRGSGTVNPGAADLSDRFPPRV
jgi:hypothetical protein